MISSTSYQNKQTAYRYSFGCLQLYSDNKGNLDIIKGKLSQSYTIESWVMKKSRGNSEMTIKLMLLNKETSRSLSHSPLEMLYGQFLHTALKCTEMMSNVALSFVLSIDLHSL